QNAPVLYGAVGGGSTIVTGLFNSAPNSSYIVHFYGSTQCSAGGFGQGEVYLGSTQVSTDGSGNAAFGVTLAAALPDGRFVTATVTDSTGSTSEFSACMVAQPNNTSWDQALALALTGPN